jgi:subtilisin family serine protease
MDGQTTIVTKGAVIAASRGILIVNSAGNEGNVPPPENTLIGPADASTVLAVGAVNFSGQRTGFSSVGPTADGRIKPDVMAQGSEVYAAGVNSTAEYEYVSGTSFSCPLTAGTAALLLEAHPDWTNLDLMEALKMTADNSMDPNNKIGWGIIDALAASEYIFKKVYAPKDFSVRRLEDNYAFFIQYVDRLSWKANPANQENIQYYALSARFLDDENAEFVLIAEFDAQTFAYDNKGLLGSETFLYRLTAVDKDGIESNPVYARF